MSGARFSESFLGELKSRIRASDVIGRKVKLTKRGKEWVGLSPFTAEKTPSFYVNDQKQFFKCFSSGKFGDVITFLQETERLSFAEAVEKLADEAGMDVPKDTQEDRRVRDKRETLLEVLETAAQFFETELRAAGGQEARGYLDRRGLPPGSWDRYRLGYAPDGWRHLIDHLAKAGHDAKVLVEAGLAIQPDSGKDPYDRFRNRLIFPIEDAQGRVVAFGGRTLDPDAKPKYLNSPESMVFHKGRQLYRYKAAREALADADGKGLVVCEGYMDVIALSEAGIGYSVAPLGTALTEDQLSLLWRVGPEPTLCFDGDTAGVRAANSAIDRALPHLEPGTSLYFTLLPDGLDPDDMIRERGADAMKDALNGAGSFVDMLWTRERDIEPIDTPERRAGLEARLDQAVERIQHAGVKRAYRDALRQKLKDYVFEERRKGWQSKSKSSPAAGGWRARHQDIRIGRLSGSAILARLVDSPRLFEYGFEQLWSANIANPDLSALRDAIFEVYEACGEVDREHLTRHLKKSGKLRSIELLSLHPAQTPLNPDLPEGQIWLSALEPFSAGKDVFLDEMNSDGSQDETILLSSDHVRVRARMKAEWRKKVIGPEASETGAVTGSGLKDALDAWTDATKRKQNS